jgi:hypothetical protein
MSGFNSNDKVVCINDDCRQSVWGQSASEFSFPGGLIQNGATYCVERVFDTQNGTQGLVLTTPKIYLAGSEIGWNSTRFRRVHPEVSVVRAESTSKEELDALAKLKQSLLQRAFAGDL